MSQKSLENVWTKNESAQFNSNYNCLTETRHLKKFNEFMFIILL